MSQSNTNKRFFVDERAGIVAVRDRTSTDPDYQGLHISTTGVVWSRMGVSKTDGWELSPTHLKYARELCDLLNGGIVAPDLLAAAESRIDRYDELHHSILRRAAAYITSMGNDELADALIDLDDRLADAVTKAKGNHSPGA